MSVKITKVSEGTLEKARKTPQREPKLTFLQHVIKQDTYMVLAQSGLEPEDEFGGLYYTQSEGAKTIMRPPFDPKVLASMVYQNNILSQCVDAMEVNVDGTGHEFVPAEEGKDPDQAEMERAKGFFDEPYPQQSMVEIRRKMRRDKEGIGYAFVEILRNPINELVALRYIPAYMIRFVKLDAPVQVKKTVMRGGKEIELTVWERERRFVQRVGGKHMRYFREYGATRNLHVDTGEWETAGDPANGIPAVVVPPDKRATELKLFNLNPDVLTPYGLPRWINELPSVLGSRKAEENNLEFFDAGGIPPAIIFIQGGTLAGDMSAQLRQYLSGQMKSRNRAVVVEAQANSGSLESVGSVQVKVERFGSERVNDAMFMEYDRNTEEHVRTGFRLPPLFLGKAADYNFATAQTAYMIAEAQVFDPERTQFDDWVNRSLMRELNCTTIKFRSKPITLKDVETQIQAMTLASTATTPESLVDEVNKIAGLTLEAQDPLQGQKDQHALAMQQHPDKLEMLRKERQLEQAFTPKPDPQRMVVGQDKKVLEFPQGGPVRTIKHDAMELLRLSQEYMDAEGLRNPEIVYSDSERARVHKQVDELTGPDRDAFLRLVSLQTFGRDDLIELVECEHPH